MAEQRPDMNIIVAAFTVSEKSSNMIKHFGIGMSHNSFHTLLT